MNNSFPPNEKDTKRVSSSQDDSNYADGMGLNIMPSFKFAQMGRSRSAGFVTPGGLRGPQFQLKRKLKPNFCNPNPPIDLIREPPYRKEGAWNVTKLKEPPKDYVISRTSRLIRGTALHVICSRIVSVLKRIGVVSKYDAENATARCETHNFTKIDVNLFRGFGEYSDGIIVEVRKTSRGGFELMQDIRSILDAAEERRPLKLFQTPSIRGMSLKSDSVEYNDVAYITEALDLSERHLQDKCLCTNITGMKTLISILDIDKTECQYVLVVCKSILLAKSNIEIRRKLQMFIENKTDENNTQLYHECRSLALTLIQRTFRAIRKMGLESYTVALNENPWLMDTLVPTLVDEVMNVEKTSGNALTSLRCLNELMKVSIIVVDKVLDLKFNDACEGAKVFGETHCDEMFKHACRALEFVENF